MWSLILSLVVISYTQGIVTRQPIISAKSGVIHYVEGEVFLDNKSFEAKGRFENIKENQIFRTTEGRAEILLTPGTFLYIGENSSIKMQDSRLINTQIEIISGSVIIQASEIEKEHNLTFITKGVPINIHKSGIYYIDTTKNTVRVYKGEALINLKPLGTAKIISLDKLKVTQFDINTSDELYRWAKIRSGYLAVANVAAANTLMNSGYTTNCFDTMSGFNGFNGRWKFNPYFGMFTYVPCNGMYRDPYGFRYYSPRTVQQVYYSYTPPSTVGGASTIHNPRPTQTWSGANYDSNLGYNTYSSRGDMNSSIVSSSSSTSSSSDNSSNSSGSHSSGGHGSSSGGGHGR